MQTFLYILIFFLLAAVIVLCVALMMLFKKIQNVSGNAIPGDSLNLINQNIQGMQSRLDTTNKAIGERLDNAARVIGTVSKELGQVQEIGRQMQSLQDFFKSPKLRGNIGEQVLKDLLEQYFSRKHFDLQHRFHDGQIVDAIIKTSQGIIPIDAKFPLENFQKMNLSKTEDERAIHLKQFISDVKKHIQSISKKYILPGEQTVDFAIMYVPNETVYYEIIRDNSDLNSFAYEKKVFPVSPNSFYYFLRVLMLGLQGEKVEEQAKKILSTIHAIQKETEHFGEELGVASNHINHAAGALNRLSQRHVKLTSKIDQVKLIEGE